MKNIMKRAHEMAKKMEGDYRARMALALRQAWKEAKGGNEMIEKMGDCMHIYTAKDEYDGTYTNLCRDCEKTLFGEFAELEGTEKQVAWAKEIRRKQAKELARSILRKGKIEEANENGIKVAHKMAQIKEAKFWIDGRYADTNELLKAVIDK